MPNTPPVLRLQRQLSESEVARQINIKAAARELVSEVGYEASTVRGIACRAGVAPATVYRYYTSKDYLLYEVMIDWASGTVEALGHLTYVGTPVERVSHAFQTIIEMAVDDLNLLTAGVASFRSPDTWIHGMSTWQELFTAFATPACGDDPPHDLDARAMVLGHVLIACFLNLTAGRTSVGDACAVINTAASYAFA